MNTDNSSISGETIDYGPCAFLDAYHPAKVFSSIDEVGRYAFSNQPGIARWNLTRLAECLVPLLGDDQDEAVAQAEGVIDSFAGTFFEAYEGGFRRKLGLGEAHEGDRALIDDLLARMSANEVDFTAFFRRLCDAAEEAGRDGPVRDLFVDPTSFDAWAAGWRTRLAAEPGGSEARRAAMRRANPAVIPRNHSVEAVIAAATERGDFAPFERLGRILARPFDDHPDAADVTDPPPAGQQVYRTFCGT